MYIDALCMHVCYTLCLHSSLVLHLSALKLPDRNCFMDESMSTIERMLQLLCNTFTVCMQWDIANFYCL